MQNAGRDRRPRRLLIDLGRRLNISAAAWLRPNEFLDLTGSISFLESLTTSKRSGDSAIPLMVYFCRYRDYTFIVKRKILITVVVLAAGLVALLAYDSGAEMVQNTMGILHRHTSKLVSSALSSLGMQGIGIILMVVVIAAAVIVFRGKDEDTI
jgi:hypothetical protein